jgi:hypothetical protein
MVPRQLGPCSRAAPIKRNKTRVIYPTVGRYLMMVATGSPLFNATVVTYPTFNGSGPRDLIFLVMADALGAHAFNDSTAHLTNEEKSLGNTFGH